MSGPLPPLLAVTAPDGRLDVVWERPLADGSPACARASLVISLRPLTPEDAPAFWAGELDTDLIRQPVDPRAGQATVHLPAGREVGLMLVLRQADGGLLPSPTLRLAPPPKAEPAQTLEAPVAHHHDPAAATPLVFVNDGRAPDLTELARRVASQVAGAAAQPASPSAPAGFGSRQRWSLTRLTWPLPPEADTLPLLFVRRDTFLPPESVAAWADAPPADAGPLPPGTDALVDAEPEAGAVAFYSVLLGPAPWRPLPLAPLPPPFEGPQRLALLGDVEARLSEGVETRLTRLASTTLPLAELPLELDLIAAAVACLPAESALHQRVTAELARLRAQPSF